MWDTLIIQPMINLLLWIYSVVGQNFGLAIIIFTVLIRLLTHPLTVQQMKSAKAMQDMQQSKKWLEIQKKYKDNKEALAQEQMKLYQELGINPFGSCLPLVIQFPIIIGLYQAVTRALAVTPLQLLDFSSHIYPWINASNLIPLNSKFLWLNLSLPEQSYGVMIGSIGLPIITILVVVTTFFQSKLMTPPPANPNDQSAQMTKMMNLYMPLLMGWMSYTLSSGLALYFLVSNLVGVIQYAAMGRLNWSNLFPGRKPTTK
ncbi:MAG TPA: YidC/Oxa1 family membrane protein insertase [Anaerolineales bacterium]|nr:YidC/Oxa1 family membrane protein insertase [Anaerolineales bacterium]